MKTSSKLKLGIGALVAAFFAIMPTNVFAAQVKVGNEDITSKTSNTDKTVEYNSANKVLTLKGFVGDISVTGQNITIKTTSAQSSKKIGRISVFGDSTTPKPVLTIEDSAVLATTGDIAVYHKSTGTTGIKLGANLCAKSGSAEIKTGSVSSFAATYTIKGPVSLSASGCKDSNPDSPETIDIVYVYAAVLVASSAIFAYRRHLAKR
ncbi:MAG: hypothetical protein Q4A33_01670 [Candidatus Saccharibacteria bacterium]|nr:hypothetical protein [Candidatus Saccharibacteria bacterium]